MAFFPTSTKGGGQCLAFPDVCDTPAPPAPFVPQPYPNTALEDNLKKANKADAGAKSGDKASKEQQQKAIDNLKKATGIVATSATQAVLIGKTMHGKYPAKQRASSIRRKIG